MSDVTGYLSPVTRQDDCYSLDLISGFLDVQLHCLFESVNSDMNPNESIFEKMPSVFGPHVVSECVRYFLVCSNFYLKYVHFIQSRVSFLCLLSLTRCVLLVRLKGFPSFVSVCLVVLDLEHEGQQTSVCFLFPAPCGKKI